LTRGTGSKTNSTQWHYFRKGLTNLRKRVGNKKFAMSKKRGFELKKNHLGGENKKDRLHNSRRRHGGRGKGTDKNRK